MLPTEGEAVSVNRRSFLRTLVGAIASAAVILEVKIAPEPEAFSWDARVRRKVFYSYPTGEAPLTGLLNLLNKPNATNATYNWWST